jgi:hypothetical protein
MRTIHPARTNDAPMANPRISFTPRSELVLLSPAEAYLLDEMTDCSAQWRESGARSYELAVAEVEHWCDRARR